MKKLMVLVCAVWMMGTAGCAMITPNTVVGTPTSGWVYSDVQYPHPRTEVVNKGVGSKRGTAMLRNYVGLVAVGDASIEAAMRDGGITQVYTVDHHLMSVLGVYVEWTTIATGE